MKDFAGRLAVVTGGGSGMGRELVRLLAAEGAHVAMCDVSEAAMAETAALAAPPQGVRVTAHRCDVGIEAEMMRFAEEVRSAHGTGLVHLLINNAGIGGGGSFVAGNRAEWERTFAVCWWGVYHGCRAFLPGLMAAEEGHIVNVSSINGFWGTIGPTMPNTAYVAAKFAVKGFSESLITDLRLNAPHISVSVVMPGHIGTPIVANTMKVLGYEGPAGLPAELETMSAAFRDNAPTSAAEAATEILDGVRDGRWRILVGDDARGIDALVRETPEDAYELSFIQRLVAHGHLRVPGEKP